MKQIMVIVMAVLALLASSADAQNALSVPNITIPQGGQAPLEIQFKFEEENVFSGFQFDVSLAEGLSLVEENGKVVYEKGNCYEESHQITANFVADEQVYAFGCLSLESEPILGTKGTLLTVTVEVDASLTVGTVLKGNIRKVALGTVLAESIPLSDVEFTITIDEPDDGRLKFNESSTILPKYTAGQKADVTMQRTIKANQWNTIVLPFTLTKAKAEAAFGSDVQLAEFTGFETIYASEDDMTPDAININLSTYTMTAKKGMPGGKPFVIKTSKDIESFQADNVTLAEKVNDVENYDEYDTPGRFTGTFVKTTIPEDGLFISDNKFWYSAGKSTAKAFRCWFELGAVLDKETNFEARVIFKFDDETSGIATVKRTEDESFYDLMGRKLLKANKKGIYVKNGRKVVVK